MRRPSTVAAAAMLCATIGVLAPRVARAQQAPVATPSRLDSLAAQLVELELQRVTRSVSSVLFAQDESRDLSPQIAALHAQLRALPTGVAADREATNRVVLALDARAATVRARLRELRLVYTDEHPAVRLARDEVRTIDQRMIDLRGTR